MQASWGARQCPDCPCLHPASPRSTHRVVNGARGQQLVVRAPPKVHNIVGVAAQHLRTVDERDGLPAGSKTPAAVGGATGQAGRQAGSGCTCSKAPVPWCVSSQVSRRCCCSWHACSLAPPAWSSSFQCWLRRRPGWSRSGRGGARKCKSCGHQSLDGKDGQGVSGPSEQPAAGWGERNARPAQAAHAAWTARPIIVGLGTCCS